MKLYSGLLLLFCLFTASLSAQSDNYRAVEWDLFRLGYASPSSGLYSTGVAFGTEVRYNVNDNISVGFRPEAAAYVGSSDNFNDNVDVGIATSFVLTGDYYIEDERSVRPFGGMGVGFFSGASVEVRDGNTNVPVEDIDVGNSLGIVPRLGIELGHFRVSVEYNLTFSDNVSNYFSIMLAPTLFGGPK